MSSTNLVNDALTQRMRGNPILRVSFLYLSNQGEPYKSICTSFTANVWQELRTLFPVLSNIGGLLRLSTQSFVNNDKFPMMFGNYLDNAQSGRFLNLVIIQEKDFHLFEVNGLKIKDNMYYLIYQGEFEFQALNESNKVCSIVHLSSIGRKIIPDVKNVG